jgi:hypothetical protein
MAAAAVMVTNHLRKPVQLSPLFGEFILAESLSSQDSSTGLFADWRRKQEARRLRAAGLQQSARFET